MFINREAFGMCCDPWVGPSGETGWTWTLTSQFSVLLDEAEKRFGPRDKNWTPVGIEFGGEVPNIWYPGNRGHVSIKLTDQARSEPSRALFQLAHETIHILAPTGGTGAPVIEEGLATLFSHEVSNRSGAPFISSDTPSYMAAEKLTKNLLADYPEGIKQIREKEPAFTKFTPDLILSVCPKLPAQLAATLCQPFNR